MPQIILYERKIIFSGSLLHKTPIPWILTLILHQAKHDLGQVLHSKFLLLKVLTSGFKNLLEHLYEQLLLFLPAALVGALPFLNIVSQYRREN